MAVRHGLGRYFGLRRHHTHFRLQMYQDYWRLKKSIFGCLYVVLMYCIQTMSCSDFFAALTCSHSSPICIIYWKPVFQSQKVVKHVSWFNHDEDGGGLGYETNQLLRNPEKQVGPLCHHCFPTSRAPASTQKRGKITRLEMVGTSTQCCNAGSTSGSYKGMWTSMKLYSNHNSNHYNHCSFQFAIKLKTFIWRPSGLMHELGRLTTSLLYAMAKSLTSRSNFSS